MGRAPGCAERFAWSKASRRCSGPSFCKCPVATTATSASQRRSFGTDPEGSSAVTEKLGGCDGDRRDEARRPLPRHRRYHRAAQEHHVPDMPPDDEGHPFEYKASDWGRLPNGRLVALDYSAHALSDPTELGLAMQQALLRMNDARE
jgi:hypothetical protein